MDTLSLADIQKLTNEYGEAWAVAHVQRLLKLIEQIGTGLEYDSQVIIWAVYLHDWGAFPKYYQKNLDHALISKQIVETEIFPLVDLPTDVKAKVLEAIELHDLRDPRPASTTEALLLREADFLDFLGAIGVAREFARGPKDLQKTYQQILKRKELLRGRFTIPLAQKMAGERMARMEAFLDALLEESYGFL
jgi:HD superfamily phosphodiesterase